MTCYHQIQCPHCGSTKIKKFGKNPKGKQRYYCQNPECPTQIFMLDYTYKAYEPGIKDKIDELSTQVLAEFDSEVRFCTLAATGDINKGLEILDKLDEHFSKS